MNAEWMNDQLCPCTPSGWELSPQDLPYISPRLLCSPPPGNSSSATALRHAWQKTPTAHNRLAIPAKLHTTRIPYLNVRYLMPITISFAKFAAVS